MNNDKGYWKPRIRSFCRKNVYYFAPVKQQRSKSDANSDKRLGKLHENVLSKEDSIGMQLKNQNRRKYMSSIFYGSAGLVIGLNLFPQFRRFTIPMKLISSFFSFITFLAIGGLSYDFYVAPYYTNIMKKYETSLEPIEFEEFQSALV